MRELPNGWKQVPLSIVCSRIVDGSHNPPKAADTGFPMLSARNIQDRRINFDDFRFISEDGFATEHARTNISPGDVLLTIVGTIGRTAVVNEGMEPFALQRSVAVLKPLGADSKYLSYSLESPELQRYLIDNAKGTAQKGIYLKALADVEILLAPLKEQKRIADKLDVLLARVDACRERLDHVPQVLKRFRRAVLSAATSGQLTEDWREGSEVSYHDFDGEPLSFPKSWTVHKVGGLLSLIDGDRGPNYPKQHDYLTTGHCLFLSTKNVRPFGFLFKDEVYISEEKHKTLRNGTLVRGDVIITTRGTLGNVAVYDESVPYPTVRINSGMLILRNKGFELLNNFLKFYIASPLFSAQLNRKQSGSAQPQIPAGILRTFLIPLPSINEQHEIVRRVETLFAFADLLDARYTAARKQVDQLTPSLIAKAFRGELVPQDPNDEPAEKLLERIRGAQAKSGTAKTAKQQQKSPIQK